MPRKTPLFKSSPAGPLYQRVLHHIRLEVGRGKLRPGEALPSERALTEKLGVSRGTIRQAIREGVREGLLHTVNGSGTYIATQAVQVSLVSVTPFPEAVRKAGGSPSIRFLSSVERTSDPVSASALGMKQGEEVITLRLLTISDDDPLSIIEATIPAAWGREVATRAKKLARKGAVFSLYQLYMRCGIRIMTADQTLEVGLSDEENSRLLQIPLRAPVFLVHSLSHDEDGNPKEVRRTVFRGDRYRFVVRRSVLSEML